MARYVLAFSLRVSTPYFTDDAALVTQELCDEFLKEFEGAGGEQHPYFIDLATDEVKPDFVGRKWLVVVDYHS